jgi:hypothetical protein
MKGGSGEPDASDERPDVGLDQAPLASFDADGRLPRATNVVAAVYGLRAIRSDDDFAIRANGGVLGRSEWGNFTNNDVIGPQAGVVWARNHGPWSLLLQGTALAGYNAGRIRQHGEIETDLVEGDVNNLLYVGRTQFRYYEHTDRFSRSGEIVAEVEYRVTDSAALRFAWTGVVVDNVMFAEDRLEYRLPDMGLRDPGNERLFVQNFYCGFEFLR